MTRAASRRVSRGSASRASEGRFARVAVIAIAVLVALSIVGLVLLRADGGRRFGKPREAVQSPTEALDSPTATEDPSPTAAWQAPGPSASAAPPSGATCVDVLGCVSNEECDDGCTSCICDEGRWICDTKRCSGHAECPSEPPLPFTPCEKAGTLCGGWGVCSPVCACDGVNWQCASQPCADECPTDEPGVGTWCKERGKTCEYGTERLCACSGPARAGPRWMCHERNPERAFD